MPTTRTGISINGTLYEVPASSVRVLRKVRFLDRARVVCIDAICIDQSNIREREQQVAFMRNTYRNSQGNLIDLGEVDVVLPHRFLRNMHAVLAEMHEDK